MPKQYADDAYFLLLFPQFKVLQRAQWKVTVLSAVEDTEYSITASTDPTPYAVTATGGETVGSLRGKLKTATANSLVITAAASLTDQLLVTEVKAGTVALAVAPDDGLAIEVVTPADKWAALREAWLLATQPDVGLCAWGEKASVGHATLTAHRIARALATDPSSGLSASDITAMRLGPAAVSFGGGQKSGQNTNPLATTGFGVDYLAMLNGLVLTPIADVGAFACVC